MEIGLAVTGGMTPLFFQWEQESFNIMNPFSLKKFPTGISITCQQYERSGNDSECISRQEITPSEFVLCVFKYSCYLRGLKNWVIFFNLFSTAKFLLVRRTQNVDFQKCILENLASGGNICSEMFRIKQVPQLK